MLDPEQLSAHQQAARTVYVDRRVMEYAVALTTATREPGDENWVEFGASPRGSINLIHAGRALALLRGRDYMLPVDVRDLARDVLRHRIVLTYEALAAGVDADRVLDDVLERVPMPRIELAQERPYGTEHPRSDAQRPATTLAQGGGGRRDVPGPAPARPAGGRAAGCGGLRALPAAAAEVRGPLHERRPAGHAWPGARGPATCPPLLALLALAALLIAVARPQRTVAAERREATVLLVFDTSGSMLATDVQPSRLAAAQGAGMTFTDAVPDEFRIGVIGFGSSAQQLSEPTTDHARVKATISSLQVKGATAMGDAIKLAIDSARVPVPDGLGGSRRLPAAIVLLGDGASTRGDDPIDVVQQNKKYKIPIYTVALGSQNGTLTHTDPNTGATTTEPVPPDLLTLQDIARDTGGQFFATADARKLEAVYRNLGTRLTKTTEKRQVTSAFAGGALVLLMAGAGFGLARSGRLP